ncbi:hypothetical protein H9I45_12430 [Polaribacter haliotis]|uniref:Uncharacterized protein n=1 Tax=Polaribacter haliotis TaxID=1888915 RepID=A0A7L8ADS3_9FLAO|nr:hypothetical protein [Polaribacter haliotis]QOD60141.1 hypothetical protein H9I45_12430 [Polaribacter haliotis]
MNNYKKEFEVNRILEFKKEIEKGLDSGISDKTISQIVIDVDEELIKKIN